MDEIIEHYGVKRRSGRYPYGSGKDPQRSKDILNSVDELRGQGMSEADIAKKLGYSVTNLRSEITWANKARKESIADSVSSMKERGMTNTAIASELGISEASVRNYMSSKLKVQVNQLDNTVDILRKTAGETGYLDIGAGIERQLGISETKLKAAVKRLEDEGYVEHKLYVKRLNDPSKYTTVKVLTKEKDLEVVKHNSDKIKQPNQYTDDGGLTFTKLRPVESVKWDDISIKYGDKGGSDRDGLIELRPGIKDLDLGNSKYAQVRIGVGGTHYLKGMAVYSDDLPQGVNIRFNTNKDSSVAKKDVLKKMNTLNGKVNEDNPFGAMIYRQSGALNIVNEEGTWDGWKKGLSAQFLSKQPTALVKDRLDATFNKTKKEFDELRGLTNPLVKRHLMEAYSNEIESKSQHLKTLGLPKTKGHVLLPYPDMKASEVYAPNYENGTKLVLVRYPHGGIFELPEVTVNNKFAPAKKQMGNAKDAIGIHPSVAQKLSGADFDGDTVYAIPNNNKKVKTSRSLKELKNFDPNMYKVDHKTISPEAKQHQMGNVSNLITDMTIKGATQGEIARAVRHSMVVIDSEKHNLDYKQSAIDNGISALKKKYQTHTNPVTGKTSVGASTFISKRKVNKDVEIDPYTGKRKVKTTSLYDKVDNISSLSSGTTVENLYVDYVKKNRALKKQVDADIAALPKITRSPSAAVLYKDQVQSLSGKLNTSLLNAPRERHAQVLAAKHYYTNLDYDMDKDQKKKLKSKSLVRARSEAGAHAVKVDITNKEWEAIQAGAVSNNMLNSILNNADMDQVKKLATPKKAVPMSPGKIARAKAMTERGYSYSEIASALGVSISTIKNNIVE